eukprot:COSAG02_NODE_34898_length_476_cov_2.156499_1_plen_38_part_01
MGGWYTVGERAAGRGEAAGGWHDNAVLVCRIGRARERR